MHRKAVFACLSQCPGMLREEFDRDSLIALFMRTVGPSSTIVKRFSVGLLDCLSIPSPFDLSYTAVFTVVIVASTTAELASSPALPSFEASLGLPI